VRGGLDGFGRTGRETACADAKCDREEPVVQKE
jgi:hypothetical protein